MTSLTGGPRTEEGKEVVRWNAARHGIRSPAPVVPGIESTEEWERHLGGVLDSLSPEGSQVDGLPDARAAIRQTVARWAR